MDELISELTRVPGGPASPFRPGWPWPPGDPTSPFTPGVPGLPGVPRVPGSPSRPAAISIHTCVHLFFYESDHRQVSKIFGVGSKATMQTNRS